MTIIKLCRRCAMPLVERINRSTGEPFLGCSDWPRCEHSEPLPESIKLRRQGQQDMFENEGNLL